MYINTCLYHKHNINKGLLIKTDLKDLQDFTTHSFIFGRESLTDFYLLYTPL